MPTFDGSGKMTTQAWIHKLDTFLALRPMTEIEAIKYATLHLEGVAHDWWYHGMVTLQHNQVTEYQDFVDRLVERFDKNDLEVYFQELAQLKQTSNLEYFIGEFQRLAVMVPNISKHRLIVLFIKGISKPLRGWIKSFDPISL